VQYCRGAGPTSVSPRPGRHHRLERRGWVKTSWGASDNNRRAKYYELTRRGRAQLEAQTTAWRKLAATVGQVLETV